HAIHGVVGRDPDIAGPLQRPEGYRGGLADRREVSTGTGEPDWIFCEHTGAADRPRWRPDRPGTVAAGANRLLGRVCAPGRAVRKAGGGIASGARPEPQPAGAGSVRAAERTNGRCGDEGHKTATVRRAGNDAVRSR